MEQFAEILVCSTIVKNGRRCSEVISDQILQRLPHYTINSGKTKGQLYVGNVAEEMLIIKMLTVIVLLMR